MDNRIDKLEADIRDLARRVHELEGRMVLFATREESERPAEAAPAAVAAPEPPAAPPPEKRWTDAVGRLPLVGRLFIVMGGAYLLRALTEASALSAALGISLGLLYALLWCGAADRAAAGGRWWSGAFHAIAAVLTAYPLLWEAVTRFRILRSPMETWLLGGLTAAFLTIACRRRFQTVAWLAVLGALGTSIALMFATNEFVPHAVFLILLGVTTLWLGYEFEWRGLRWPVALAADVAVFGLTLRALAPEPRESPDAALTVQLLLLGLYLASVAVRTLVRARNVIPFEVVQMVAAFLLGFVGAVYTTRGTGVGTTVLGGAGLILGAACYAVAFAFVDRREGRGRNFYFYTSLALVFALTGSGLLLRGTALSLAWVVLAALMGWLGWRYSRLALTLHATISIVASAFAAGLVGYAVTALAGAANLVGAIPSAAQLAVLAGAAFCVSVPTRAEPEGGRLWSRIQRIVLTVLFLGGVGAVADSVLGRVWGGLPGGGVDPGILATLRTIVLSLATLLLAWMGKRERFVEWGWLVYPVLAATGLKILFEDFPRSRPATLFLALAVYGCALIVSPRVRRKRGDAPPV